MDSVVGKTLKMRVLVVNKTLPAFGARPRRTPRLTLSTGEGVGGNSP